MNEIEIKQKLDQLADLRAEKIVLGQKKQELVDTILTPEIKAKIAEIDMEFNGKDHVVSDNIANLEAEIKKIVLAQGSSVKGTYLQAQWTKGRISWDTKGLDGYAAGHPEILFMRKEGDPFVVIK